MRDDLDYDGMGNQGRVPQTKTKMENKEAIILSKVIVGIAIIIAVATFPPIIFVGILAFAIYTLHKAYK
tara:strand:+ start:2638 stop:2844 length:207 start_codon:yes stop_codon:yes gene_type:complete